MDLASRMNAVSRVGSAPRVGAERFEAELYGRFRKNPLISWAETLLAGVLIVTIALCILQMIQDVSQGRVLTLTGPGLWFWAAPTFLALGLLSALILRRINLFWTDRLRAARSDLRRRLAQSFVIVGIAPTTLILILAFAYFSIGFSGWINQTFDRVLADQTSLADGYAQDLKGRVEQDVSALAENISRGLEQGLERPGVARLMQRSAETGSYWHLYLYDATGTPTFRYGPGQSFDPIIPGSAFRVAAQALNGRLNLSLDEDFRQVKVLVQVPNTVPPLFIYGAQLVDSSFADSAASARQAREELQNIETQLRLTFFIVSAVLIVVAMVLLLASAAVGLWFANRLLEPIGNIIAAASDMGEGSLDVRVPVSDRQFSEFQDLSRSFNVMASRLENQQADLREANIQIEQRSQFTSAVLTGVSAGVLGLGPDFSLTLPNKAAGDLLGLDLEVYGHADVRTFLPEFTPLLGQATNNPESARSQEIKIFHKTSGNLIILLASAIAQRVGDRIVGYVLTFDDISALASAQRHGAWSEVARRIAHEIKNPLTPIQLSTERLKRRFGPGIDAKDQDVFNLCLDTISRQVETISRLVSEFSSFSRMPTASLRAMDLTQVIRQAHFLQASRFEDQDWVVDIPEMTVMINGDASLLSQAIQNLLKNAGEAAQSSPSNDRPRVWIKLTSPEDEGTTLVIRDNGEGFSEDMLPRLGEPYVSTKKEGTGLGLAIVKKIMEDHAGGFSPANHSEGGAQITLKFPAFKDPGEISA